MSKTKKMVQLSLLVAVGIALHVFEAMLPVNVLPVPGAKLGLANIVTLLTLVLLGYREALGVVLLRSLLASLIAGTFLTTTFYLSFAGALGSGLIMGLLYHLSRGRLSLVGISISGAVVHNVSQLLVAAQLIQQAGIFMYLPYLLLFALPTGYFNGLVVSYLLRYSNAGFNSVTQGASYNRSAH
ncbi:MAG: Gx transporter family protein [bacterium]|nr:Gx transporter family protein [Bacillota bacterium]